MLLYSDTPSDDLLAAVAKALTESPHVKELVLRRPLDDGSQSCERPECFCLGLCACEPHVAVVMAGSHRGVTSV